VTHDDMCQSSDRPCRGRRPLTESPSQRSPRRGREVLSPPSRCVSFAILAYVLREAVAEPVIIALRTHALCQVVPCSTGRVVFFDLDPAHPPLAH